MREEYVHAIYVLGCGIPWLTPRGALLIECSEQNAMSMPSLGVNVASIGASILMSSHTSKNKKETSRRTDAAQSYMVQWCVTACMHAATCALAWALAGVNSFPW